MPTTRVNVTRAPGCAAAPRGLSDEERSRVEAHLATRGVRRLPPAAPEADTSRAAPPEGAKAGAGGGR